MKNIRNFYLKNFIFLAVKVSVYLNRYVFVMKQRRPRSDATENGVLSGSTPLATHAALFKTYQTVIKQTFSNFIKTFQYIYIYIYIIFFFKILFSTVTQTGA